MTPEQARRWCVERGLPGLAALPADGDPTPWAEGLIEVAPAGDAGLVRPAVARALAERAGHPAVLPALALYVRSAPQAEAVEFATEWALDAWQAHCEAPVGTAELGAALTLAGLAVAHALEAASGPPLDKAAYNAVVQAVRDLFERLARSAPPAGSSPPGMVPRLLAAGQARAVDLGFDGAVAAWIPALVRICRDFGRSLPASHPGLAYMA